MITPHHSRAIGREANTWSRPAGGVVVLALQDDFFRRILLFSPHPACESLPHCLVGKVSSCQSPSRFGLGCFHRVHSKIEGETQD